MPVNNQKQYIEIPLSIEDTPLLLFEKFKTPEPIAQTLELALNFIQSIDKAVRSSDPSTHMLNVYFNEFQTANSSHFAQKDWPAVHQIQMQYEQKDFGAKIQTIYNQFRLRNRFERARKNEEQFVDVAEQSWENYQSIFQREFKEISFPALVIWDIFDNFLYQFSKYHQAKLTFTSKPSEDIFNLERTQKLLAQMIALIPSEATKTPTSKQTFGYFALLVAASLELYQGNYKQAQKMLSRISLQHLSAYSRAIGALLHLFLLTSYNYFILQQYKQSARVIEMVLLFYQKNKKYFTGVKGEQTTIKQFQQLACLLCLDYIFLQQKPKSIILQLFKTIQIKIKDKQNKQKLYDKYIKLKQKDQSCLNKLFLHLALPSFNGIEQISQLVGNRFTSVQKLTLNTVLQHYTQISVQKLSKMLRTPEPQIMHQLESFNNISASSGPWNTTIMQPLLSQTRKVQVSVVDGVVKLDTQQIQDSSNQWEQYHKEIAWLVQKVDAL